MTQLLKSRLAGAMVVGCLALSATPARAVVVWDESIDGDISTDRLSPSTAALVVGSNTLTATSVGPPATADREYIHFSMPPNSKIIKITMDAYQSLDGIAFIAVQEGATFTEPPGADEANVANILGYTHFGTSLFDIGDDVLPAMSEGLGAIGFTPPLPANDYTFWIQQTGTDSATYTFDFQVVPEPGTLAILGVGCVLLVATKRRRAAE